MLDDIHGMFLQTIIGIVLMGIGVLYMAFGCHEKVTKPKKQDEHQKLEEEKAPVDNEKGEAKEESKAN